ncbi:MAG: DnaJ domain-containing protein [Sandaracinaceae bacterium]
MSNALPEPLAEGDLARTPFAHLLLTLRQKELSGTLVLWDPRAEVGRQQDRIRFMNGRPTTGRLLARASRLDRGMLPLFARTDGPFAFYADVDLVGTTAETRAGCIDTLALIAASLRGSSRDDAVNHVLSGAGDKPLRYVRGADLQPFALLPEEQSTLELLRAEPASLERLIAISPLQAHTVRRLVYLALLTKQVEPWDGTTKRQASQRPSFSATHQRLRDEATRRKEAKELKRGTPEPPPDPPEHLSDRHRALWEEIRERTIAIETENYYEMLGVARDAASKDIETAYYGKVKKWHPDRIPAEVVAIRSYVERIFQYLTRAQETLSDESKRGSYLETVQEGGGTPEAERELTQIVQAAMDFQKVEVMLKRRDLEGALELANRIIEVTPDEAHYLATRAEIRRQLDPTAVDAIMTDLRRALSLSDGHDAAHHSMGLMLRQQGKDDEALEHFEKAAELNPRNIDAVREVRIATMRGKTSRSSSKSSSKKASDDNSLFGKLFGSGKKEKKKKKKKK